MDKQWLRIRFRVDASYYDSLTALLEACLAVSVSIENDGEDECFEVAFPKKPTWEKISVTALFYDGVDVDAIIDFVTQQIFPDQSVPVIVEQLKDQDWERVWLDQYEALEIDSDFWIVPSWRELPDNKGAINLLMDPGLAFGTGTHATTFLCLQWIAKHRNTFEHVLDYGAGSGILAIATLLLGARDVMLVDIDPMAVYAAKENLQLNRVDHLANCVVTSDFVCKKGHYDLVIANILAEVLIEYAGLLSEALSPDGKLLLSGILVSQEDAVKSAFLKQASYTFEKVEKEGWLMLIATKKSST